MAVSEDATIVKVDEPTLTAAERRLTQRELGAYQFACNHPQPKLSPDTQARLFSLFLNGTDCVEIAKVNKGLTLGQIVQARVEGGWDEKRDEHIQSLLNGTRLRLQQITLESVEFTANLLAAAHKQYGDALKKYIQTGAKEDLGEFNIHGLKGYREAIELLKSLTGQDSSKKPPVNINVSGGHISSGQADTGTPIPTVTRILNNPEARSVIHGVVVRKKQQG